MRVTALLFNMPGRGEFYRQHLEMPDASIPKTADEFGVRSFKAMKHFWPEASISRALTVDKCEGGERYVVEGQQWSVEWAKDVSVQRTESEFNRYMGGEVSVEHFIHWAMSHQPTERREL